MKFGHRHTYGEMPQGNEGRDEEAAAGSQGRLQVASDNRAGRGHRTDAPSQVGETTSSADTLISDFSSPDCEEINFCCVSVWDFGTAAPADSPSERGTEGWGVEGGRFPGYYFTPSDSCVRVCSSLKKK